MDGKLSDLQNATYNSLYSVGSMLGPLFGAYAYDYVGYRKAADYVALFYLINTFACFFFYSGMQPRKDYNEFKRTLDKLNALSPLDD